MERVLPAPVRRMKYKPSTRLNRTAVVNRAIGRIGGIDAKLFEKPPEAQARPFLSDADADGSIVVVNAKHRHRPFESGIGHSGHREQHLA